MVFLSNLAFVDKELFCGYVKIKRIEKIMIILKETNIITIFCLVEKATSFS